MRKGWENINFVNCIDKVPKQKQVKSKDYKQSGKYPIVSQEKELISGYWDDDSYLYRHHKPIIIFGDHTKEVKFIDFDFVVGADGTQILCPKDNIDSKFFYYALKATKLRNLGYARHFKLLKEKTFGIPSLPEQQRIVSYLDAQFGGGFERSVHHLPPFRGEHLDVAIRVLHCHVAYEGAVDANLFHGLQILHHSLFGDVVVDPIPIDRQFHVVRRAPDLLYGLERLVGREGGGVFIFCGGVV